MLDVLQEDWAIRALLASMAVGLSCGILGAFLVLRNMSMIGDALSHAILPGIVLAFFVFGPENTWGFFLGAVVAGWLSSFLITWIQSKLPTKNDAAIGIVFTCMFSLGVIGISYLSSSQHVHIDLKDYLFGNVLGVSDDDLMISFSVTLIVIAGVLIFYRSLFITTFQEVVARTMGVKVEQVHYMLMLLLSFAVVSALQTVGVILVVAMLITPASTALLFFKRLNQVIICAACLGVGIAIGGFFISYAYNFPPGPSMAVLATLIYVLAIIFSPDSGLVSKYLQRRKEHLKILQEDVMKCIYMLNTRKMEVSSLNIQERLGISSLSLKQTLNKLGARQMITPSTLTLSAKGIKRAEQLIRAHRLWESYMVTKMGMDSNQIHEEAERLEHHLSDEMLNEVAADLNYPETDPHGSPIPKGFISLMHLSPGDSFQLAPNQENHSVIESLWDLSLMPNSVWTLDSIQSDQMILTNQALENKQISKGLASQIEVVKV